MSDTTLETVQDDTATPSDAPKADEKPTTRTVNKTAKVETFNGAPLPTPIEFPYSYEELLKGAVIPPKELPDEDDIRAYVNTKRNSSARAKAQNEALTKAGIEKPTLEDPDFRLKQMVKILVANNMDEATAIATAKGALGMA